MRVRPLPDKALGWAYRPDGDTVAAHNRFKAKAKKTHFNFGADKPHEGGNLAEALVEARKAEDKRRGLIGKRRRRKKVAKKVSRKGTKAAAPASKKRTAVKEESSGKMIPLKTICAEMDLDPKATRVKLRRMIAKGDIDWHDPNSRWEFSPKRAKEVRSLLAE